MFPHLSLSIISSSSSFGLLCLSLSLISQRILFYFLNQTPKFPIKPKFFHEPISWKKCMMVGNGLTASSRGKATLSGTKVQLAMVLQTHKCMMVIVCRTHPEKKNAWRMELEDCHQLLWYFLCWRNTVV
jgi:hypothetical protein